MLLITLKEVSDKVEKMSYQCSDRMVRVGSMAFHNLESILLDNYQYRLRTIAQRGIAARLGIPFQYLAKCPGDVQANNLNYWLKHEKNEELFFRFDGDEIRAIFTPKYKPVDNFEVLERLDAVGYTPDTPVQCYLDQEFMSLSIPDSRQTFEIDGEKITPGVSISNSEVGLASLSIEAYMLRLVCTNGLISKTEVSASYRHVSVRILEEFPVILEKVSEQVVVEKERFQLSVKSKVEKPLETFESFNRQFQLSKEEQKAVEWGWEKEIGDTMFHIVNAYTRAAQLPGLRAESCYRLQKVGGRILSMLYIYKGGRP